MGGPRNRSRGDELMDPICVVCGLAVLEDGFFDGSDWRHTWHEYDDDGFPNLGDEVC